MLLRRITSFIGVFEPASIKRAKEPTLLIAKDNRMVGYSDARGITPLGATCERLTATELTGFKTKMPITGNNESFIKMTYDLTVRLQATAGSTTYNVVLPEAFSETYKNSVVAIGSHVEDDASLTNLRIRKIFNSADTIEIKFNGGSGTEIFSLYVTGYVDTF
jgi:hypothetical protein